MGSPLSPIVANLVLQDLEKKALETINCNILFYFRYVNDILLSAPPDQIPKILDTFNSYHNRLQFTEECEVNKKISFIDLKLEVEDGMIGSKKKLFQEGFFFTTQTIRNVIRLALFTI